MKQHLSNDLLKRLKLYGYTTLNLIDDAPTYTIGKESPDDVMASHHESKSASQKLLIEDLLIKDLPDEELYGEVILPDEKLESEL
ncbi:hypothetical protein [Olivibacter sitiensis]|uniref:hypothetical protein n=1 Tax=Olivibacter sitiensis TaxID=376470 RepID=UPI000405406A|nr:hypothetical protein [Olivibacter sitiensis]